MRKPERERERETDGGQIMHHVCRELGRRAALKRMDRGRGGRSR